VDRRWARRQCIFCYSRRLQHANVTSGDVRHAAIEICPNRTTFMTTARHSNNRFGIYMSAGLTRAVWGSSRRTCPSMHLANGHSPKDGAAPLFRSASNLPSSPLVSQDQASHLARYRDLGKFDDVPHALFPCGSCSACRDGLIFYKHVS
jgi:hypothetical protein